MENKKILIVGASIFGATLARVLQDKGYIVKIIEKEDHIAGHIYDEKFEDFYIHKFGAHIFHTSNKKVWDFVNRFTEFNNYINSPIAYYNGEVYNLPFNMNTFAKLLGVRTPQEAKDKIEKDKPILSGEPKNLEEQAISMVGNTIYKTLIKDYTEKQWGRECKDLPASIIKRLPLRFVYDNNYFNDKYQGIPINGYTNMVKAILENIDVELETEYKHEMSKDYDLVIYTGPIDNFYDFKFGALEYRSLQFDNEVLEQENYQGVAVVNYTGHEEKFTRILEHKHFKIDSKSNKTVITKEYSREWKLGDTPYYPINDQRNQALYEKYKNLDSGNVIFGGRLGLYSYFDMDKTIENALKLSEKIIKR